jgi:hypothetical protein
MQGGGYGIWHCQSFQCVSDGHDQFRFGLIGPENPSADGLCE